MSIRFQKSFIQRFSASSSLFIFPPWNCVSVNSYSLLIRLKSTFYLPPFHCCWHVWVSVSWESACEREKWWRKAIWSIFSSWIPPKIDKTDRFTTSYSLLFPVPQDCSLLISEPVLWLPSDADHPRQLRISRHDRAHQRGWVSSYIKYSNIQIWPRLSTRLSKCSYHNLASWPSRLSKLSHHTHGFYLEPSQHLHCITLQWCTGAPTHFDQMFVKSSVLIFWLCWAAFQLVQVDCI